GYRNGLRTLGGEHENIEGLSRLGGLDDNVHGFALGGNVRRIRRETAFAQDRALGLGAGRRDDLMTGAGQSNDRNYTEWPRSDNKNTLRSRHRVACPPQASSLVRPSRCYLNRPTVDQSIRIVLLVAHRKNLTATWPKRCARRSKRSQVGSDCLIGPPSGF